jgi:hypothetical protein
LNLTPGLRPGLSYAVPAGLVPAGLWGWRVPAVELERAALWGWRVPAVGLERAALWDWSGIEFSYDCGIVFPRPRNRVLGGRWVSRRSAMHRTNCMPRLLVSLLFLTGVAGASDARDLVFTNVNVVSMEKEEVLPQRDVLIHHGIIRSIEAHVSKGRWPAGTIVVDGSGKYLLPGLADMHVHMGFGDEEQLKLYVVNGVTTVLNLSGTPKLLEWKTKIAAGELLGPTFYTTGPIIDGDPPTNNTHVVVRNRGEAEREVDAQVRLGYDFIKPYSALSREGYEGIVDAARRNKIRLVGHVAWSVGVQGTIQANQDAIAHVEELYRYFVDRHRKPPPDTQPDPAKIPVLARELADHHTWVITTLSANDNILKQATNLSALLESPDMQFIPKFYLDDCRKDDPYANRGSDWVLQNKIMVPFLFKIAAGLKAASVTMMAGTDATNPMQVPGISLHDELEELVEAGLSPYEALVTSTRNPAIFLGRSGETGTVTPGKIADLLLVEANPLEQITNTRKIAGVMVRGQWLDAAELERMKRELVGHFAREESDPAN